jgi:hypothetical protein
MFCFAAAAGGTSMKPSSEQRDMLSMTLERQWYKKLVNTVPMLSKPRPSVQRYFIAAGHTAMPGMHCLLRLSTSRPSNS